VCLRWPLTTQAPLGPHLGVQQLHSLIGIQELLFSQFPGPLRLLQRGPQLLHFSLQQVGSALHDRQLLLQVLLAPESIVQMQLGVLARVKWKTI
jgi:hypothetical protein